MDWIPNPPRSWSWLWITNGKISLLIQASPHPSISHNSLTLKPPSQPIIAVQNTLPPAQLPLAMALVMFSQSMGAALFLSFSSTIFTNSLKTLIPKYAPSVNAQSIIDAGATLSRKDIPGTDLIGVLIAYAKSVDRVFYLTAGMGVGCFVFAWGMGWKDIRKKSEVPKA